MEALETLKQKVKQRMESEPYIRVSVALQKPHVAIRDTRVKIVGVYPNFFQVEAEENGRIVKYCLRYGEVLAGIVEILDW